MDRAWRTRPLPDSGSAPGSALDSVLDSVTGSALDSVTGSAPDSVTGSAVEWVLRQASHRFPWTE